MSPLSISGHLGGNVFIVRCGPVLFRSGLCVFVTVVWILDGTGESGLLLKARVRPSWIVCLGNGRYGSVWVPDTPQNNFKT